MRDVFESVSPTEPTPPVRTHRQYVYLSLENVSTSPITRASIPPHRASWIHGYEAALVSSISVRIRNTLVTSVTSVTLRIKMRFARAPCNPLTGLRGFLSWGYEGPKMKMRTL